LLGISGKVVVPFDTTLILGRMDSLRSTVKAAGQTVEWTGQDSYILVKK
jgi:hypothetical protein